MPNYGYHLARAEGGAVRRFYSAALPALVRQTLTPQRELPFEVFAYSGEAALPEQVASIRSFLKHAGRPLSFTVMSDGSYVPRSFTLLKAIDRCVDVQIASERVPTDLPAAFRSYLREHPTGRQLAVIMSRPTNRPALYVDSDVLFFPGAAAIANHLPRTAYLADCQPSADNRLFRSTDEQHDPVNTGVVFLSEKPDWKIAIERFMELRGEPSFFTNQTLMHLAMHANSAPPLDSCKFVLQLDDQFVHEDRYAGPELILRHYVSPVRHKFWTAVLRHG
ncbi:MAG: hypothetical protein M3032_08000 [Verrucomicrobiota bacterium]|nr:hypothetical protein [Verrucomicrobiota bacterium]